MITNKQLSQLITTKHTNTKLLATIMSRNSIVFHVIRFSSQQIYKYLCYKLSDVSLYHRSEPRSSSLFLSKQYATGDGSFC